MPVKWHIEKDNLVTIRISGILEIDEYRRAQADMEASINNLGTVKVLIFLENFTGWAEAEGWEDVSFVERNDSFIKKMAIVGDEKWRDMVYIFTLKGLRLTPIEYFSPDAEAVARHWLFDTFLGTEIEPEKSRNPSQN